MIRNHNLALNKQKLYTIWIYYDVITVLFSFQQSKSHLFQNGSKHFQSSYGNTERVEYTHPALMDIITLCYNLKATNTFQIASRADKHWNLSDWKPGSKDISYFGKDRFSSFSDKYKSFALVAQLLTQKKRVVTKMEALLIC